MRFANIIMDRKGRCTVGDDIQLIAIENVYKHMGIDYNDVVRIPYSKLSSYDGEYVILPLSFPFYGYSNGTNITNFSDKIVPVFLGLSTALNSYNQTDINYLKKFEPIGCRDMYTMNAVRNCGISGYLNGCLTAAFPRVRNGYDGRSKIYCVDIPDSFCKYIPKQLLANCEFVSHVVFSEDCPNGTEQRAKEVYENYINNAKMIITTRMHAALPCHAFGIPVVLAKKGYSFRFTAVAKYLSVYTEKDYEKINWDPIVQDYEPMKTKLLNNAAKQIMRAYEMWSSMYDISQFYENNAVDADYLDHFSDTATYIQHNYRHNDCFTYAIWGITQTAEMVINYISKNYCNAKLLAVIDQKRNEKAFGLSSTKKEIMSEHPETICFVCAGAAIPEAKEFFAKIHHEKVFYCWEDGLSK